MTVRVKNLEIGNGKPKIMGIINTSPESFYKESISVDEKILSDRAIKMEKDGVDIIDIGGMSTAPYLNTLISVDKEIERLRSAINAIKNVCRVPVSIDTCRADVVKASIELGIDLVNDVTGLKYDGKMKNVITSSGLPIIIGAYGNRSITYRSGDISETINILQESIQLAIQSGINEDKLIIDPLVGFFRMVGNNPFFTKISHENWYERDIGIISNLKNLSTLSKPICISVSRKSFIGHLFGLTAIERLIPSIISQVICLQNGTDIIRTHDVKETKVALALLERFSKSTSSPSS
ncbi:MAG TPA: dihydropteroate synthase [Nitrososphaeraceae archaeon]|nr:dihydropteroate synthase [Nitrososphaeraceae archaeon]